MDRNNTVMLNPDELSENNLQILFFKSLIQQLDVRALYVPALEWKEESKYD